MKELALLVFVDLSPIIDYFASNPLLLAILITNAILTFSFILVLFCDQKTLTSEHKSIPEKIASFFFLVVGLVFISPLLLLFSWFYASLLLLLASLLSGFSLLCPSRKSRAHALIDLALLFFALTLAFVLRISSTPQELTFAPITLSGPVILLATFLQRCAVFWGVIETARGFVYRVMTRMVKHPKTATALFVALFGLSTLTQDITGKNTLALIAEELPDYAFIAGTVLAVLAFIKHRMAH